MCAVMIHDQVDGKTAGKTGVDVVQKPQELLVTMPPVTVADGDSARHIQGRKQRCHTMTFVIMRLPGRHTGRQRKNRLRTVQRLDLTLLIHAQHDRMIRRIHIQPHDVPHLLHELRVFGELKVFHPMRLQSESMPDPYNGGLRQPCFPAISRLLQWVLLSGIDSSVWVMTSSTCASLMDRGAPGRGSSKSPSRRPTRKRSRHLHTVAPVTCNFFATTPLLHPSSHLSTCLSRIASAWADFGRRASIASFSFSSGVTFSGLVGRPMATLEYAAISVLFQCFSNSKH